MSRFSIVNVMGRRSTVSSDGSERPSIISTLDLNRQLNEEAKRVDQHLFFGPQQAVFEGGDRTRVIHGERKIQKNSKRFWLVSEPLSMDRDSTTSLIGFPTEPPPKKGLESVTSSISAAGRYIGQKVAQMKFPPSHVNEDSFCDGCGMDPIVGNMYSCSKCDNYSLCESCYQSGIHGFEDSELLKDVREDYALRNVMETCRHKVPEKVFHLLLKTVCRGQVDKFNFLATWICSVVLAHPIHELSVRGIEIPHLDQETRATLVTLLTPVLAERNDLEVCMEWFCPQADNENVPNSKRREETLRIWVATDKDSKSPFAVAKDPARDADTESDLSPTSGSNGPASPSMSAGGEPESPEGTPPSSPMHYSAGNGEASFASSPPASPTQHAQLMVNALSLANDENNLAAGDASDDGESDSVKSDIAPRKVDGVSKSGQPSEGIEM